MPEIAEMLGVTHQRVHQIYKAGRLPEPAKRDGIGPLWTRREIERWAKANWWGRYRWRKRLR